MERQERRALDDASLGKFGDKKKRAERMRDIYQELAEGSASAYHRRRYAARASAIDSCGSLLKFLNDGKSRSLIYGNFCKMRLCPMCNWRRSRKVFGQVSEVMNMIEAKQPDLQPIFLTLTIKNCSAAKLKASLDRMFHGWKKLMMRRGIKRQAKGWFRALEITYNETTAEYHPHFHAVMLVPPEYFGSSDCISTRGWVRVWREALGVCYDPVCHVESVDERGGDRGGIVAEVAKYTVKDADLLVRGGADERKEVVRTLDDALFNRRLIAFGGCMRKAKLALKLDDPFDGDLSEGKSFALSRDSEGREVVVDRKTRALRRDLSEMIETYQWRAGVYVRER